MPFPERLQASQRLSERYWERWQSTEAPLLHHYTDAVGLHGILTNRELWLTGISYLNDSTEHQQAGVAARKALESLRSGPAKSDRHSDFYQFLGSMFDSALGVPRIEAEKDTFIGCFSTKADSLSQWRAYGRGEGGFSIVFRAAVLWDLKQRVELGPGYWLLPCDYDLDRIVGLNRDFIEEALEECLDVEISASNEAIAHKAGTDARWIGAGVKHPAFKEEDEWRLVYYGFNGAPPSVFHRSNSTLTPYIKFPLGTQEKMLELIEEIWVGPQRHPELAAAAARNFAQRQLGGEVRIRVSETPFRVL